MFKPDKTSGATEKVLGLRWLSEVDQLTFNVELSKIPSNLSSGKTKPTKREFLSLMMSVFDPLGFLNPFSIQARFIFQNICKSGIKWDDTIGESEFVIFKAWIALLPSVAGLKINRCYQVHGYLRRTAELHVFCDASKRAYGAVVYWRFCLPDGTYHVAFVNSKSRVTDFRKEATIPRILQ